MIAFLHDRRFCKECFRCHSSWLQCFDGNIYRVVVFSWKTVPTVTKLRAQGIWYQIIHMVAVSTGWGSYKCYNHVTPFHTSPKFPAPSLMPKVKDDRGISHESFVSLVRSLSTGTFDGQGFTSLQQRPSEDSTTVARIGRGRRQNEEAEE